LNSNFGIFLRGISGTDLLKILSLRLTI